MAVHWAGFDLDAYDVTVGSGATWVTTSGWVDTVYQDGGIRPNTRCASRLFTSQTDLWFHAEVRYGSTAGSNFFCLLFRNNAGTEVVRFTRTGTGTNLQVSMYNGSSMQNVGSAFSFTDGVLRQIDIHIQCGSGGLMEVYVDQSLVYSETVPYAQVDNVATVDLYDWSSANKAVWSQVFVADEPTLGWKMYGNRPNNNGTYTAFSGSYTDIDEQLYNDSDFISGGSDGDKETVKAASRGTITLEVKAIGVSARARRDSSGPQNMDLMLRNGSDDHFEAVTGLSTGMLSFQKFWHTNPTTGNKWSASDAASADLEFGVRART